VNVVYAESSAVLRWLLGHADARVIEASLSGAHEVVASALTSTEVARTLQRLVVTKQMPATDQAMVWATFTRAAAHWKMRACSDEVLVRAGAPFPLEPVRTLDAIHLATAALHQSDVGTLTMLSCDERVRDNALALGMSLAP
jgi:predicted nucleic acid-binding protein